MEYTDQVFFFREIRTWSKNSSCRNIDAKSEDSAHL